MKTYFFFLLIVKSSTELVYVKIPFSYCYSCEPVTCEEKFFEVTTNKQIKNDGIYNLYKGWVVMMSFCASSNGYYYDGYLEKTNWLLGYE